MASPTRITALEAYELLDDILSTHYFALKTEGLAPLVDRMFIVPEESRTFDSYCWQLWQHVLQGKTVLTAQEGYEACIEFIKGYEHLLDAASYKALHKHLTYKTWYSRFKEYTNEHLLVPL